MIRVARGTSLRRPDRRAKHGWWLLVLVASITFGGCDACKSDPALATLTELKGDNVRRDFDKEQGEWTPAKVGAEFRLGDGVRSDAPSTAALSLIDGSRLEMRPGTMIRFLLDGTAPGEQAIDVQTGEAIVSAGGSELRLRTHVGLAILSPGGQLSVTREGDALRMHVDVGVARFRDKQGREIKLDIGDTVLLEVGAAVLHKLPGSAEPSPAGVAPAPDVVRTVAHVKTKGAKLRRAGKRNFVDLAPGEYELAPRSSLRLPAGVAVELVRGEDRTLLEGPGDFLIGEGGVVTAKRGGLQLSARRENVEVIVPGGTIVARAANGGSAADVRLGEQEAVLSVKSGSVNFQGVEGRRELGPGGEHRWSYPPASEEVGSEVEPDFANMRVRAGESFVVHAPEVPVSVGFDFTDRCKGDGVFELAQSRRRTRGQGEVNVLLPAGVRAYSVRCIDERGNPGRVVAKGSVHVLEDAGTRKLPPRAPTSLVDADGRSYTIYYQNQLPELRVRWPNAPVADLYKLDVDGEVMSLGAPEHLFESGSLRDGPHRLTFEAQQRKSRTAKVEVRFDNTAATASLTSPAERSFSPGDTVTIEGVALPAWKLSVQGGTIEQAGGDRFQGRVQTSAEEPDIAVRLSHPRLGTHYYLRRAAGSR